MEKLNTVSKNKTWSWLRLRSWAPNWKIQVQIEESRENHYAIQYDQNQIPYDWLYNESEGCLVVSNSLRLHEFSRPE